MGGCRCAASWCDLDLTFDLLIIPSGKWIVTQQYIDDSYTHGRWLAESLYEWGPRWREGLDPLAKQFLNAPGKWRSAVQSSGQRAFVGWRVAVLVDHQTKRTVYSRYVPLYTL